MKPILAIAGSPNVGKSTLFNRIAGWKKAIVANEPGVTRDRNYAEVDWEGRTFTLIATGGFEPVSRDRIFVQMRQQCELAMDEGDVIVFVMDGREGLTPSDKEIGKVAKKDPENMTVELPVGTLGVRGTRVAGIAGPNQSIAFLLGPDPQNPEGGKKDAFSASNGGQTEWIDDPGWGAKLLPGMPPEIFELPPELIEQILEALNNPEGVDWSQLAGLLEWLGKTLPEGNEPPWLHDVLEDQQSAQDAQDHSPDAGQDGESDSYYDNW